MGPCVTAHVTASHITLTNDCQIFVFLRLQIYHVCLQDHSFYFLKMSIILEGMNEN